MITTFIGPMFSGKSDKLIEIYNKIYNKDNIICFKPVDDNRDLGVISSRNKQSQLKCYLINRFEDILFILKGLNTPFLGKIILIDEAQFIKGNVQYLNYLSIKLDYDIYISGLSLTSDLKPFGCMPEVLSISDNIVKLWAHCFYCGRRADYTKCLIDKVKDVLVGNEEYIPVCKNHIDKDEIFKSIEEELGNE